MSNPALNWAYALRLGNSDAKNVLACLADMAGPDGGCFALQPTLAGRCDLPDRSLRRALAFLQAAGLLTVERGQRGCRYVLNVGATFTRPEPERAEADRPPRPINGHPSAAPAADQTGPPGLSDRPPWPIRSATQATPSIDEPKRTQLNLRTPPTPHGGQGPEGFDSFWVKYPNCSSRHDAERAWQRAVRGGADPGDIVAGLEIALVDGLLDPREGGRFAPPAAAWLRGRRWLDWEEHSRRQAEPYLAAAVRH